MQKDDNSDNTKAPLEFFDPSPQMQALVAKQPSKSILAKYQFEFDMCPAGKSFKIELTDIKLSTLRPMVSRIGKENMKKFKITVHSDCYEIYRKV